MIMSTSEEPIQNVEALLPQFQYSKLLHNDPHARRITLLGTIESDQALLLVERTPFSPDTMDLNSLATELTHLSTIGTNDIYHWFLGTPMSPNLNAVKLTLMYPATAKHIAKYSPQTFHTVSENSQVYHQYVRPYMVSQVDGGRLAWVYNILEGRAEQEDVVFREENEETGFILTPDLNWDRQSKEGMRLLAIVKRRDILCFRDLTKAHIVWLKDMRSKILAAVDKMYGVSSDRLKLYVHYQPTYYHFHIHVVNVNLDAGATQAVGKAFGLENLINQLELMADGKSLSDGEVNYTIGEGHDLWKQIFGPLSKGELKVHDAK